MNFSKFFISRPIFAAVLSLLILIAGSISLFQLPISEYPEVVPPSIVVRAVYPGANPRALAEAVSTPLDMDRIARDLGAERRGKVVSRGGYFGAVQLAAEVAAAVPAQQPTS